MTAEQFSDSKYKPVLMPMPFGADDPSANYVIPSVGSVPNAPNFEDGFPSAFSSPKSLNGQYVTRQQMNGIGNLATRYEFFRRVGGLNTFNADFAIEIGGYPRGCVLDFLYDNKLYKVLSLVDNNKVDFTGAIPTESQASHGITAGSVDGYHWLYCNIANQVIKYNEIAEIPDFTWIGDDTTESSGSGSAGIGYWLRCNIFQVIPIATFTATKNGNLIISGNLSLETVNVITFRNGDSFQSTSSTGSGAQTSIHPGGFGVFLCDGTSNPYEGYGTSSAPKMIYSGGDIRFIHKYESGTTFTADANYINSDLQGSGQVVSGNKYSLYVVNKGGTITDSTLKVILQ